MQRWCFAVLAEYTLVRNDLGKNDLGIHLPSAFFYCIVYPHTYDKQTNVYEVLLPFRATLDPLHVACLVGCLQCCPIHPQSSIRPVVGTYVGWGQALQASGPQAPADCAMWGD